MCVCLMHLLCLREKVQSDVQSKSVAVTSIMALYSVYM